MRVAHHLRDALRDVLGPSVRAHGYRGTSPTWRKRNALGDLAVITVQASASNSDDGGHVANPGVDDMVTPDGLRRRARDDDEGFGWFEDAYSAVEAYLPRADRERDGSTS